MKSKKKNKKLLAAASVLALIALGAGTFAWFQGKDSVKNHFEGQISGNDFQIVETFVPPTDMAPGDKVNKDVAVANISEYDAIVRVSFEESMAKLTNTSEIRFDGTDYNWTDGTTTGTPAVPVVIPTKSDYVALGFTDATSKIAAVAPITIGTGADAVVYTFHFYEKETKAADPNAKPATAAEYTYVAQWVATDGSKGKAFLTSSSGMITRDDAAGTITIDPSVKPSICVVDKTYNPAEENDWLAAPGYTKTMSVDKAVSMVDDKFELAFAAGKVTAAPTLNSWYFNAEDNYFYFIGKVAPGGQSEQLLDDVTLLGSADNSYMLLKYDLTVKAEGTQAVKDAVKQTGWLATSTNTALITALEGICND